MRRGWVFARARRCQSMGPPFGGVFGEYPKNISQNHENRVWCRRWLLQRRIRWVSKRLCSARSSLSSSLIGMAIAAAPAAANTDDIIALSAAPVRPKTTAGRPAPARPTRRSARSRRPTSSSNSRAGIRRSASPSSSSKTKPPGKTPVGASENGPRRPPPGPQRQPAGDDAVHPDANSMERLSGRLPGGVSAVTASAPPLGLEISPISGVTEVPVYNIVPPAGHPARFGMHLAGSPVYLEAEVSYDGDYHEGFTIAVPELPIVGQTILKNRLVFKGRSGDGTFITTPTTCFNPETEASTRTSTRPTCSPPRSTKRKKPGTNSRPAPSPPSSRPCRPEKNRSSATKFPTTRRPAPRRGRPKPTPRPGRPPKCTSRTSSPPTPKKKAARARRPSRRNWRCRSAWASTPRRPTA